MRKIIFMLATVMSFSMTATAQSTTAADTEKGLGTVSSPDALPGFEITTAPENAAANVQADLQDSRYNFDFGQVMIGRTAYASFTLRNTGGRPMWVQNMRMIGMDFASTSNCPRVLRPGERCRIQVTFRPFMEGPEHGTLRISTSGGMIIIRLTGWGVRRHW